MARKKMKEKTYVVDDSKEVDEKAKTAKAYERKKNIVWAILVALLAYSLIGVFIDPPKKFDSTEGVVVQSGDTVNISYTGYIDGEEFDGGSDTSCKLKIGSGNFIDGFEDALIGHKTGETFDIDLTFPEDYGKEELAGQPVTFTVTIKGLY